MVTEEKKCCCTQTGCGDFKKTLGKLLKVILGLGFLVLGGAAVLKFWPEMLSMIKGGIGLCLILVGVITLAIAKE
jgi:hypothetical protein